MSIQKRPVSERALVNRVNRALAKDHQVLHRARANSKFSNDLGRYYVVDLVLNVIQAAHVDIEKLALSLNVMHEFEQLSAE